MKHAFAVIALLGLTLTACGRNEPAATTGTEAPLAAPATEAPAPEASASAATPAALDQAAAANQESADGGAGATGDSRLERVAALPESAQLPSGKWKAGTHYLPVTPAQPTSAGPGEVEVAEIFWYGCGHCFALEPFLETWAKGKPSYVKFVRVPVTWGPVHRAHGRLFYTLEALGKLEELHGKVFEEIHRRGNFLVSNDEAQTMRLQLAFARANGISEAEFTKAYESFAVNNAMQRAEDLTRRYRVEGVPMVVINGRYTTDVGMAGNQAALIQLITDLAASEKSR